MTNWYINSISVYGTEEVMKTHRDIISVFVKERDVNINDIEEFKYSILARTFLPEDEFGKWPKLVNSGNGAYHKYPSYSEYDCKWAYLDERIKDGDYFKIISGDGVPCVIQDLYLELLLPLDPKVIVEMFTVTGHPNEERIRYVQMKNSIFTEIKHGYD